VAAGNVASIEEWSGVNVAGAHHLCHLFQNKYYLVLLPFTQSFKPVKKILLQRFGGLRKKIFARFCDHKEHLSSVNS
tara:strand:+ start:336 stop:566 length:231 start_codon:yes stop_codon:yes gene_type:complete